MHSANKTQIKLCRRKHKPVQCHLFAAEVKGRGQMRPLLIYLWRQLRYISLHNYIKIGKVVLSCRKSCNRKTTEKI